MQDRKFHASTVTGATGDILRVVQLCSGVDFSAYRPQTAERRIRNRMTMLGIADPADYQRLLRESSQEVQLLIARLTIKVSRLYRNAPVFDALRTQVLPQLACLGRPLRIWSAGCGCGEEAYTLAMLMEDAALAGDVVATEIDPIAIGTARQAWYDDAALAELPPSFATRFLSPSADAGGRRQVGEGVRRRVTFERADLTATCGPAAVAFDLVCCRNVLIYWNGEAQRVILGQLVSRLHDGGWLCLGEAEWPDRAAATRLDTIAARLRLFRKREEPTR